MTNFESFALPPALQASLKAMNFTTPTPIQAQAIPLALAGHDILGTAQTGTGKTGAFGVPLVAKLLSSPRGMALVMTPTRELATQVIEVIQQLLGKYSPIKAALLIGGESMPQQIQQLKLRPRIIVGTPGRINDLLERGNLMLHDTQMLVLDETDRMLDMGFEVQIERIIKYLPQQRQNLLFSATLPPAIIKMAEKYMRNPQRIAVGAVNAAAKKIDQQVVRVQDSEKFTELLKQLSMRSGTIIIFVKTKHGADRMAQRLRKNRQDAEAIHGDLHQNQRERVINAFREKHHRILVATDIASRGLDIPHIEHVINYDLPQAPEDYIHRIGRTARAEAEGSAVSLVSPDDEIKWVAIQKLLDPNFKPPAGPGPRSGNRSHPGNHGNGQGAPRRRRRGGRNRRPGAQAKAA